MSRRTRSRVESHPGHYAQKVSQVHAEHTSLHDTAGASKLKAKVLGPKPPKRKAV